MTCKHARSRIVHTKPLP